MGLKGFEVSGQESRDTDDRKCFTLQQANAALPLVQRVVRDIVAEYQVMMHHHNTLHAEGLSDNQLQEAEAACLAARDRLHDLALELSDIGCELKDWEIGLVDFPSTVGGQSVYLCWRLGEERVNHWHHIHAGFAGREPLE